MLPHIVCEQILLDLINRLSGLVSDLFETDPDPDGATNVITLNAGLTALTAFNTRYLLAFTVKLLNLPALTTRLLCRLRFRLSQAVGGYILRALGGEHKPEQSQPMTFGKVFEVHKLAILPIRSVPG